jgi:ectoine hydroxylase-related dioxygenase (phytanoyl-CoA dioxygenase family)
MPPFDQLVADRTILKWELEPGDVIVHHPLTIHFSEGNRTLGLRRRALALRYLGDDAVFDARPGTFMENPNVRALFASEDLLRFEDGAPMINEAFPAVWPRG